MKIQVENEAGLPSVAEQLLDFADDKRIWLFIGNLGAGKTTLIKALCKQLGVEEVANSPTFSIVNEYAGSAGEPIYHFDFYRIESEEEALDIGVEEYFYSGSFCFIEWPEKVEGLLPESYLLVEIKTESATQRSLNISKHG